VAGKPVSHYNLRAKCICITRSLWEHLGVVRPESQDGKIPEVTGQMPSLSGAPGSAGESSARI